MARSITSLDDVTANNLGTFKKINQVSLPTSYSEAWYKEALNSDQIVKLAFFSELPVGGVKAKPLNLSSDLATFDSAVGAKLVPKMVPNVVYIETLAVLTAYQNLGVGKQLLDHVIDQTKQKYIHDVCVHVHVTNTHALEWYEKHGFEQKSLVKDYYKLQGLESPDAYLLYLKV
ncbi:N-acetyltransferase 5 [Yamadazyma tenuis]|uniref:N-acetyltransferase domain-containing protein n=1 Tax=Candida tenuis (strain ATCC 10573 / BCRC 21748 / CBS 615 / JCM 9827 / NBRC 10315 / NRRL Y-1498 / VKM Y-70) TaxID=590646 RepID=G3B3L9_CANTC|nr:uncharacterized protein CANTEDRAFT_104624 [Yamadazyma tenuis ATCC 10573]EGV64184.1 hypothetical protein CANTEDRAFT_104624 [Yamadazyma tenuis ATCC 10573]WEJ96157.1 N-acetyltransferase 5 [Yamadazyma tenuis]